MTTHSASFVKRRTTTNTKIEENNIKYLILLFKIKIGE